jgi:hypothetical protein
MGVAYGDVFAAAAESADQVLSLPDGRGVPAAPGFMLSARRPGMAVVSPASFGAMLSVAAPGRGVYAALSPDFRHLDVSPPAPTVVSTPAAPAAVSVAPTRPGRALVSTPPAPV